MREVQKSYYAIIPANVRYDKDITPNAKLLYGEITALCNEKGYCWAGNSYFSDLYKVTNRTITGWINSLEQKGYINRTIIRNSQSNQVEQRIIRLTEGKNLHDPHENNFIPYGKNLHDPHENNFRKNNTSFNNTSNKKDDEEETKLIINFWDKNGFGFNNINAKNKLLDWLDEPKFDEPKDIILFALEIAADHNVLKYAYVESILKNWLSKEAKTLSDCQSLQAERSKRNEPRKKKSMFEQGEESKRRFAEQAKNKKAVEIDEDFLNSLPY